MTAVHTFDPRPFPRTLRAWQAADAELSGQSWVSLEDLREVMVPAGEILAKTASNILGDAVRAGVLQKRAGSERRRYYRIHPNGLEKFLALREVS